MTTRPNPLSVGLSVVRSLIATRPPKQFGDATCDHSLLSEPLQHLGSEGSGVLSEIASDLKSYLHVTTGLDPRSLTRPSALAYWINVYNTGALLLAGQAQRDDVDSVLGVPGSFQRRFVSVAGEDLSLDAIEHGKLRRFGDPRIHAALVCGSVSCPTLRGEPYSGEGLDAQLDDQIRHFLAAGALERDPSRGVVYLSRVFLWFGNDFVRPQRMPTLLPARRSQVLSALGPWLDPATSAWVDDAEPKVEFQSYDWGLGCTVRRTGPE